MEEFRPNRSDVHLSKEEEMRIEKETRERFEELAPKRHKKPQRSEYSSEYVDVNNTANIIPEQFEFQRLEHDQKEPKSNNGSQGLEEFVVTDYYKEMNCGDKQHHMTGTGFINMENKRGNTYIIDPESEVSHHASSKGNPATNDWTPSADDQATLVSHKPHGSEN